jgi:hypothetical protein
MDLVKRNEIEESALSGNAECQVYLGWSIWNAKELDYKKNAISWMDLASRSIDDECKFQSAKFFAMIDDKRCLLPLIKLTRSGHLGATFIAGTFLRGSPDKSKKLHTARKLLQCASKNGHLPSRLVVLRDEIPCASALQKIYLAGEFLVVFVKMMWFTTINSNDKNREF